jgi:hypothetical protein
MSRGKQVNGGYGPQKTTKVSAKQAKSRMRICSRESHRQEAGGGAEAGMDGEMRRSDTRTAEGEGSRKGKARGAGQGMQARKKTRTAEDHSY